MDDEFLSTLQDLAGKPCWGYVAGKPTGSIVSLDFGKKVKRSQKLNNPHLSIDQQYFIGEFSLMIWCSWRIDEKDKVVCSWNDSNEKSGAMTQGLNKLVDKIVRSVKVEKPAYDLTIEFENEIFLKIFSDQTGPEESIENYTYFVKGYTYTVGNTGQVVKAAK